MSKVYPLTLSFIFSSLLNNAIEILAYTYRFTRQNISTLFVADTDVRYAAFQRT